MIDIHVYKHRTYILNIFNSFHFCCIFAFQMKQVQADVDAQNLCKAEATRRLSLPPVTAMILFFASSVV